MGKVVFSTLYAHDKQVSLVQFPAAFPTPPQVIISLVGIHINSDIPKNLGFTPQITSLTATGELGFITSGFQFYVQNQNSRIDHLEYAWMAVLDDRIHLRCPKINELRTTVDFER